jgi:hypothetical protein
MTELVQPRSDRLVMLGLFAACCVGPMLVIVALSTVAGLTIGVAAAFTLGLTAALFCVVLMVVRHRRHAPVDAADRPTP